MKEMLILLPLTILALVSGFTIYLEETIAGVLIAVLTVIGVVMVQAMTLYEWNVKLEEDK